MPSKMDLVLSILDSPFWILDGCRKRPLAHGARSSHDIGLFSASNINKDANKCSSCITCHQALRFLKILTGSRDVPRMIRHLVSAK